LIGRVECVQLSLGHKVKLQISLNVLEELDIDLLLGLNTLVSYGAKLDMENLVLSFKDSNDEVKLIQAIIER